MKHAHHMLRPGMTALVAVLALTSTPLLAQAVDPAPVEPSASVIAAPPPAATTPVDAAPAAPAAALNIPKITVDMSDAPATAQSASAESAVPSPKASSPAPVERSTAAEAPAPASAKTAPAAPAATPAPAPQTTMAEAPAPESPLPTPPVAVEPETQPAMTPAPVQSQASADIMDETLPIAGGILAALALGGGALAFASRKRRYREEYRDRETVTQPMAVEPEPLTLNTPINPQPAAPAYTSPTPVAETAGAALPAGFDMSRYGRHVQAAYRGPTAENPSLSLRKRLKRARFYDQRARMGTASAAARPATPQPTPAMQPARQPEFVTSRRFNIGNGGFKPAYQG